MPVQSHDKQQVAFTQLETSLRLYAEGTDYYSVVTLAGAADDSPLEGPGLAPFGQAVAEDPEQPG